MDNQVPLFEARAQITLETYLAMNRTLFVMKVRKYRLWYCLFLGSVILLLFLSKAYGSFLFLLLFAITFPFIMKGMVSWRAKKYYLQTKSIQNEEIHYSFFQDHFKTVQSKGSASYRYSDIFRMTITDTTIYLFINDIQAFIIEGESVSPELFIFLKNQSKSFSAKKNKIIDHSYK
ncbi:YcxB family protein [Streptococcus uberis]|uniref:YcxB family protein n=1 Tax=Streptococcus uberis TaxID=1349 RepID=UPI0012B60559|nr:YcxB family protein [Streptococcus uberis]MTB62721.1 hypothetical protein [Streptococcus uberis]MTB92027.1 hypothetical protein [Streptococcus uberis]